jgi:formate hydrogenlyase subunit 3/multisubunit Na+/H+ antiporter MnhD subunit
MGVSLGSLSGLPPSPLFFSEVLILLGGIASGHIVVTVIATALLGFGFLGLAHALIEGLVGAEHHRAWRRGRTVRVAERMTVLTGAGLLVLVAVAYLLPGSTAIRMLMAGMS